MFSKLGLTNVHDNQDLLLICGDVESNPGPNELQDRKVILKLMTQIAEAWWIVITLPSCLSPQFTVFHLSLSMVKYSF